MLSLICVILMLIVFGRILGFAIRMAWGITKILFSIVFLPIILIGLLLAGLGGIVLPVILVIGVISLLKMA